MSAGRAPDSLSMARLKTLAIVVVPVVAVALIIWGGFRLLSGGGDGTVPQHDGDASYAISYAEAASRLRGLTPQDTGEQLRDWARFGLAARLGIDADRYRDTSYDTLPVRDPGYDDLVRQPVGPGRSLYDGRGVLHVLAPRGDPHESRTIGLQIDQYRTDAGADPRSVQVDHYRIRPDSKTIEITSGRPTPTARARSTYGFVTMRVDTADGLKNFLSRAGHLSWLERRGRQLWAGGWDWGGKSPVDSEDISALQRGYLSGGPRPGFSLDPAAPTSSRDLQAAIPGLSPRLADAITLGNWNGTGFRSAGDLLTKIDAALFNNSPPPAGLPRDRTPLWALSGFLGGGPAFSQARYDGGLAGTKVGMTLFYTDYVAKHWVAGVGTGVPTQAVGGFLADPRADIPWSECPTRPQLESGRLWFGQNQSGFAYSGDRVSIGAQATRLFAKSNDGGTEVEPSYAMGRGLRWWDQHYQDVADYEPQYERLDQIMRWSGALDWLIFQPGAPRLPQLAGDRITSNLRFKNWYASNDDLRERAPITFVNPPSAHQEALLNAASKPYTQCGFKAIKGGVSLADRLSLEGGHEAQPQPSLPPTVRRAGEFDRSSSFDGPTGTGTITQVWKDGKQKVVSRLRRTFGRGKDGGAVVDTVGDPLRVNPFGPLRNVTVSRREIRSEISADDGGLSQGVEMQGQPLGRMDAIVPTARVVLLQWRSGVVDRLRRAAESVQNRLRTSKGRDASPGADDVLYGYHGSDGQIQYKMGGKDAPWLSVTKGGSADGAMGLRLGAPRQGVTHTAEFYTAALTPMHDPGGPRGPPGGGWLEGDPANGDHPAQVHPVPPPHLSGMRAVSVELPDDRGAKLYTDGSRLVYPADDPAFGLNGSVEAAAFVRDYPRVQAAMADANRAGDHLYRGFPLGPDGTEGSVLVGEGRIIVRPADDGFSQKIREAFGGSRDWANFQFAGSAGLLYVVNGEVHAKRGAKRQKMTLGDVMARKDTPAFLSPRLAAQLTDGTGAFRDPPPHKDRDVEVVTAQVGSDSDRNGTLVAPDIINSSRGRWRKAESSAGPGPGPGGGGSTAVPIALIAAGTIQVICLEDDPDCSDD